MAKVVVLQQVTRQPPISLLSSSLSHFNGTKLCQIQYKRKVYQPKGALHVAASSTKKILIMGGTRFIGVTLFTRGKAPVTQQLPGESDSDYSDFKSKILHLKGDRQDFEFVKSSLSAEGFDVVYDIMDERRLKSNRYGCTPKSATVDAVDPKSRHKGKLNTESLLEKRGVNWTSLRPVYIYGPLNYNPVEEWFFHRLKAGRPIPIPNSGVQTTQLGHVKDLATAFVRVLGNEKASKQVFNISGEKYVTFDGLAKACAKAGGFPEPEIVHYNPKEFDFGKKKAFPFRDQHFFASVEKAKHVLGLKPEFDLVEGLTDSYNLDFGRGTFRKEADFSTDDMILNKSFALQS
ncbi:Chloroplast stem-loop binding protein of 41 kDa b [Hibiscus syriacus]|uniref:Chloroplast stem-loop binding protein of 41 kDa b n=1 Tax=Hibiscus syriacus TaxID=106335 RepID=A0A6A2YKN7_HIBSY|nr:Chloroplast stem-loop binding protein of 41 kDa b [Hibiscus syriacus]